MGDIVERPPIGIVDAFPHGDGEWFFALWDFLQSLSWKGYGITTSNETLEILHTKAKAEKSWIAYAEVAMARVADVTVCGYYHIVGYGYTTGGVTTEVGQTILSSVEPAADASELNAAIRETGDQIMIRVAGKEGVPYKWGASLRVTYNQ